MTSYVTWAASGSVESGSIPPVLGLSLFAAGSIVVMLMGAAVFSGRWKTIVNHAYPGIGSGMLLVGAGLTLVALVGIVSSVWTLETTPESAHWILRTIVRVGMPLGLLIGVAGFCVGWWARPRFLLPRWQREELAQREARQTEATPPTAGADQQNLPGWATTDRSSQ